MPIQTQEAPAVLAQYFECEVLGGGLFFFSEQVLSHQLIFKCSRLCHSKVKRDGVPL